MDDPSVEKDGPRCAECGGEITVRDNANGGLITVNVGGHAKAAHRTCPTSPGGPDA